MVAELDRQLTVPRSLVPISRPAMTLRLVYKTWQNHGPGGQFSWHWGVTRQPNGINVKYRRHVRVTLTIVDVRGRTPTSDYQNLLRGSERKFQMSNPQP